MKLTITYQVFLLHEPRLPKKGDTYERVCTLNDGYAGFLHPFFDSISADKRNDVFFVNGAIFGNDDLEVLAEVLRSARKRVSKNGQSWEVVIGLDNKRNPVQCKVTQEKMSEVLAQINAARRKAVAMNGYIGFDFFNEF